MNTLSPLTSVFVTYLAFISLVTIIATCLDKFFASRDMFRISEKTLIILALMGGALAEYTTMRFIRHKTLHRKFMSGLPLIITFQIALSILCLFLSKQGII